MQESWRRKGFGVGLRVSLNQKEETKVTHIIFADSCNLVSSARSELCKMVMEATIELMRRGLFWKKDEMEFMPWGVEGGIAGNVILEHGMR